jgi:chemotaxis regulatin CheY-phosphate phosphatase CheZ
VKKITITAQRKEKGEHMKQEETVDEDAGTTESVITALQKVITLLDRIKNAIEDSSSKIPNASIQLNTVTQATEVATVEILDVLDQMGTKIHMIENGLKEFNEVGISERQLLMLTGIRQTLSELKENTSNITVTLQIQDITAQKIGAANHMIESVRRELLNELNYFETAKKKTDEARRQVAEEIADPKAYAVNASCKKTPEHQSKIDEVVTAWQENGKK